MVPSSDKRPAASQSGEGGQNTTTAEHAISSPEFVGKEPLLYVVISLCYEALSCNK